MNCRRSCFVHFFYREGDFDTLTTSARKSCCRVSERASARKAPLRSEGTPGTSRPYRRLPPGYIVHPTPLAVRGLVNDIGNCSGLRDVHRVASCRFDSRCTCPLCHRALRIGWNHFVVRRDKVPARLGFPRRLGDGTAERVEAPGHLRIRHEGGHIGIHIASEGSRELRVIKQKKPEPAAGLAAQARRGPDWRSGSARIHSYRARMP